MYESIPSGIQAVLVKDSLKILVLRKHLKFFYWEFINYWIFFSNCVCFLEKDELISFSKTSICAVLKNISFYLFKKMDALGANDKINLISQILDECVIKF